MTYIIDLFHNDFNHGCTISQCKPDNPKLKKMYLNYLFRNFQFINFFKLIFYLIQPKPKAKNTKIKNLIHN